MSADDWAFALILAMVIPATLGPVLYALFVPWYREHVGRALLVSWTGLGLLVDVSVIYEIFGDNYPGRDIVRFAVFSVILCGLWYKFLVLIWLARSQFSLPFIRRESDE